MLQLEHLTLRVGGNILLSDLNLTLQPKMRLGIIGANGTGKSSLLRLITGDLHADAGELRLPSDWRLAYMTQHTPSGTQTAHDFVLDGHGPYRQAEAELNEAESAGNGQHLAEIHARLMPWTPGASRPRPVSYYTDWVLAVTTSNDRWTSFPAAGACG